MPLVEFSQIRSLLQSKGSDRLSVAVKATGTTANDTFTVEAVSSKGKEAAAQTPKSDAAFLNNDRIVDGLRMRGPYGGTLNGDSRVGFVITSDIWRTQNKAILLHAGPNEAQWTLPLRAQDEENKAGHARYAQPRSVTSFTSQGKGSFQNTPTQTFFDFPRVQFQFQTGNILPIPLLLDEVQVPYGLDDFYLFVELLNQAPLIPEGDYEGKHNYIWIFYTSLQFPQVVLKGYFDPEGISWSDSADAQTSFTWSASFLVHEMTPNLWERNELRTAYATFMKDNVKLY